MLFLLDDESSLECSITVESSWTYPVFGETAILQLLQTIFVGSYMERSIIFPTFFQKQQLNLLTCIGILQNQLWEVFRLNILCAKILRNSLHCSRC